jgi:DNA-binding response OmpR family regulator
MAGLPKIIDVHSHPILPYGPGAPVGPGQPQPKWSIESAISYMDEHDISACVLSDPDSANHATEKEARDIARRVNEALADIVSRHPSRFGAVATLPGRDADPAVSEIRYALDILNMGGFSISTSIGDVCLGGPQFTPWLKESNRRNVTLFVHPTFAKATQTSLIGLNPSVLEFMFATTRMIANMIATGAKKRFSNIKIRRLRRAPNRALSTTALDQLRQPKALNECSVARRDFSRRSKSMTSNLRREMDSLGKQPLSIVIIIPSFEPRIRSPIEPRETVLRVGSLELDLIDRTARRGNRPIDLRPREFQLLKYMMQRSDQVLTFENLIKDVWRYKFVPETNRINVHMGRLRAKVDGSNEAPMIRNLRGEGFVLSATPAPSKNLVELRGFKQRGLTQTNSNNV